ncbi:MAG TPA: Mov34/MPN/PAD-1 family protein [Gemmataceae bacterium]|jgi:proteasome lid subunit RPN8/RPN11|nr:Mov34/MPN/PAD-1 family protein [Gemmataceae bacterium]
MLQGLSRIAQRVLREFKPPFARVSLPASAVPEDRGQAPTQFEKLKRVVLTDGVGRTLFEEFVRHQQSERGHEETGWLLLGLRRETEAIVLATLPAGASRDAGVAHVRFNSAAQMVATRMLRQEEKRLSILGVVHTHPGTLRHPSNGDYRGDSVWVQQLRGREGVFGIGTLEKEEAGPSWLVERPRPHIQRQGRRRFTWYALGAGDAAYRTVPVEYTLGPDLGIATHSAWSTIECHAEALERICRQQARVTLIAGNQDGMHLKVKVPLAEPGDAVEMELVREKAAFFVLLNGTTHAVDPKEQNIEKALYMILAELAAQAAKE